MWTSKHRDPSEAWCSSQTQIQVETFQNARDSHGIAESSLDRQSFQPRLASWSMSVYEFM
jgi:hypothetical protein